MPARLPVACVALVAACAALTLATPALASDMRGDRASDPATVRTPPLVHELVVAQPSLAPAVIGVVLARALADQPVQAGGPRDAAGGSGLGQADAPGRIATTPPRPERPHGLVPLYVSFAALQALDIHSTLTAVHNGGVEQNALVAPMVNQPAAFVAFKAAATAGTIVAADRLARHNRVAAYALMFALNSAYTFVVVHNYRVKP